MTLNRLPDHLSNLFAVFLTPREVLTKLGVVNRQWQGYCGSTMLWTLLDEIKPLSIDERFKKMSCIVERRSKGKLYKALDRVTHAPCTVRKIYLDVTNAGQDDGLPTSVLRELSHLSSVDHPHVSR